MNTFSKTYQARWADMDPNRHMRHSVYNDYAAQTRVAIFAESGLPLDDIGAMNLGPILFREEVKFLREVRMLETFKVFCCISMMRRDASRWSFYHSMIKGGDTKVAEIRVDGAWLDLERRKLGTPPELLKKAMHDFPRTEDFKWMDD